MHWIRDIKIGDGIRKTNASHQKTVLDNLLESQVRDNLHIDIFADCFLSDLLSSCRESARTRLRKRVSVSASGSTSLITRKGDRYESLAMDIRWHPGALAGCRAGRGGRRQARH